MDLPVTDWWTVVFCSSSSGKHQASVERWRLWQWGTERSRKAGGRVCIVSQRVHLSRAPLALYAVPHGGAVAETSALCWLWRDVPQPVCAALPKDLTAGQKQNQTLPDNMQLYVRHKTTLFNLLLHLRSTGVFLRRRPTSLWYRKWLEWRGYWGPSASWRRKDLTVREPQVFVDLVLMFWILVVFAKARITTTIAYTCSV